MGSAIGGIGLDWNWVYLRDGSRLPGCFSPLEPCSLDHSIIAIFMILGDISLVSPQQSHFRPVHAMQFVFSNLFVEKLWGRSSGESDAALASFLDCVLNRLDKPLADGRSHLVSVCFDYDLRVHSHPARADFCWGPLLERTVRFQNEVTIGRLNGRGFQKWGMVSRIQGVGFDWGGHDPCGPGWAPRDESPFAAQSELKEHCD